MFLSALASLALATSNIPTHCDGVATSHAHLQWSEPTSVVSPNRIWDLKVFPRLNSEENHSDVMLNSCKTAEARSVFVITRSADIYWSQSANDLLIINSPQADISDVGIFNTVDKSSRVMDMNPMILHKLHLMLGNRRSIKFYLPSLVSWKKSKLTLAVSGATSVANTGSLKPYCYDILIDIDRRKIISANKDKYSRNITTGRCQVYP